MVPVRCVLALCVAGWCLHCGECSIWHLVHASAALHGAAGSYRSAGLAAAAAAQGGCDAWCWLPPPPTLLEPSGAMWTVPQIWLLGSSPWLQQSAR
jgi:hypothetical protein